MIISYQFRLCYASLATCNSTPKIFDIWVCFVSPFETNGFSSKAQPITAWKVSVFGAYSVRIKPHLGWHGTRESPNPVSFHAVYCTGVFLPQNSTSALSHISPNVILNYLCVILGTLPQPLTPTRKFAGPIYNPVSIFVPSLLPSYAIHGTLSSPL